MLFLKFFRDGVLVPILNCATSFYAGFAVFSVVGFLANDLGEPVQDVVESGSYSVIHSC